MFNKCINNIQEQLHLVSLQKLRRNEEIRDKIHIT